jgi:hypothetical protein
VIIAVLTLSVLTAILTWMLHLIVYA